MRAKSNSVKSFVTYTSHLFHYCYVLRGVLGVHLVFLIFGGIGFSLFEGIPLSQGIYFSLITSTTVGYGDVTPQTALGQCVSVFLALTGTILFGLVVAVATQAFKVTIREYMSAQQDRSSGSSDSRATLNDS